MAKQVYAVLRVFSDSSESRVVEAYRYQTKQFHPDRFYNSTLSFKKLADLRIREVNLAYEAIISKNKLFSEGIDNDTERVDQLLCLKSDYWEFLVAEELIRNAFCDIRVRFDDLRSGIMKPHSKHLSKIDYLQNALNTFNSFQNLYERICSPDFTLSIKCEDGIENDPQTIVEAVNYIIDTSKELVDYELGLKSIEPPDSFKPLHRLFMGLGIKLFEQIEAIPDTLIDPFRKAEPGGKHHNTITANLVIPPELFDELRKIQLNPYEYLI